MTVSSSLCPPAPAGGLSIEEQVQKSPQTFLCETRNRPYLTAINNDSRIAVFFKPRCKLWTCPYCGEANKRQWAVKTYQGASELTANGHEVNFLTITMHERTRGAYALKIWPSAWKKLRERASYKAGGFQYVLIPEQHRDGTMHIHAIETAGLGKKFWKDNARECGLGYMADEEEIRTPEGAAWYVTKYLSKSLGCLTWPKGFRRIRTSQGWPKETLNQSDRWEFQLIPNNEQLSDRVEGLKAEGYHIENLNHKSAWGYLTLIDEYIDLLQ